jgi:hypothetical protein
LDEVNFYKQTEIGKIKYLAYYYYIVKSINEFTYQDILGWFDNLSLPRPNKSRLLEKIRNSREIIKSKNQKNKYCLHATTLESLKSELPSFKPNIKPIIKTNKNEYVSVLRIKEIQSINSKDYDFSKLVKYCEELNTAYSFDHYLTMILITRAIIDHVPPLFNCKLFSEVCNNYSGPKSFKESMTHLNNSSRKIADLHLHTQIRKKEMLPNITQVDFSNDIDVLLGEIFRIMK